MAKYLLQYQCLRRDIWKTADSFDNADDAKIAGIELQRELERKIPQFIADKISCSIKVKEVK